MRHSGALADELARRFARDDAESLAVVKLKEDIKHELGKLVDGGGGSTSIRPARCPRRRILEPGDVTRLCLEMEAGSE